MLIRDIIRNQIRGCGTSHDRSRLANHEETGDVSTRAAAKVSYELFLGSSRVDQVNSVIT